VARRVKLPGPLGRYKVYYELLTARGWNAYKRNELNAEKITNMSLRLNYEAVVQYADIEDNDLLYFSYANQVRSCETKMNHVKTKAQHVTAPDRKKPPAFEKRCEHTERDEEQDARRLIATEAGPLSEVFATACLGYRTCVVVAVCRQHVSAWTSASVCRRALLKGRGSMSCSWSCAGVDIRA